MADYMSILQQSIDSLPENTPTARLALYRRARETVEKQLRGMPDLGEDAIRRQLTILGEAMTAIERRFAADRASLARPRAAQAGTALRPVPASGAGAAAKPPAAMRLNGAASRSPGSATPPPRRVTADASVDRPKLVSSAAKDAPSAEAQAARTAAPISARPQPDQARPAARPAPESRRGAAATPPAAMRLNGAASGPPPAPSRQTVSEASAESSEHARSADQGAPPAEAQVAEAQVVEARVVQAQAAEAGGEAPKHAVEEGEALRPDATPARPPRPQISPETAARLAEVKAWRGPRLALVAGVVLVLVGAAALAYHFWQLQPVKLAAIPSEPLNLAGAEKAAPRQILARQPSGLSKADPTTSTYDGRDAKIEVIPVKPVRNRSSARMASADAEGMPGTPVRQRAILYEQTAKEEGDASVSGTVSWQPQREGEAAHALIELPDRDAQISMLIRINNDPDLPASHLIELRFNDPRALGGTVRAIPTIVAKPTEQARGEPLVGVDVPVTDRVHWIALSADEEQRSRNIALLREGKWFDIPILFHDGKRALLTIEKGGPETLRLDPVLSKRS